MRRGTTLGIARAGLALALMGALAGCDLFRPMMVPVAASDAAPVTLSGGPEAVFLVEPQVVAPVAGAARASRAGGTTYAMWCADCHGVAGDGNGRVASQMSERPANLTVLARGNGGSLPAGHVMTRLSMAPGPYHRGIARDLAQALDGPLVDWVGSDGGGHMVTARTADLLSYLENLQL